MAASLQAVQEFNAECVMREFRQAFSNAHLDEVLLCHWCRYVPFVFTGQLDMDTAYEDRRAKKLLFRPMEVFLCGGGDPEEEFRKLKEKDDPPELCGKVFKMGEPTYSCRDCGMDPTCVLCIECFQHSVHQKHRYKMSTSGGGGYCDCGDREAWKSEPFCDVHKQGAQGKSDVKDPVSNLPEDLRGRARSLFLSTIQYSIQMLTWTHTDSLPKSLSQEALPDSYVTMLFNDEVHTYDQVITTLQRAVECSQKEAVDFATTVDREGRSVVKKGNFKECAHARDIIEKNTSRHGNKPLKVQVMHTSVTAHQTFAQKILIWLQQIISQSDGLRQLFCLLSLEDPQERERKSVIKEVLLADTQLWKAARILSHQLFMAGVLMDQECKKQFAIIFTELFPLLMQDFIEDDHDHAVSIVSESVQIFTVPTLARMLIQEHNLLHVILSTFLGECESKKKNGRFVFERNERSQAFKRAQYMLFDLKYALSAVPAQLEWTDELRKNFLAGFRKLLELLKNMQGMDSVTRQTGQHIEFEPEWEGAFNLQLKLADNITLMLGWCATDSTVLMEGFIATIEALSHWYEPQSSIKYKTCRVGRYQASCVKFDVSLQPVSIHLPVTRLLAGLYPLFHKFDITLDEAHSKIELNPSLLMELALRTQVLIAQTQAGMWRRNGYSLLNQIYFYQNVRCRGEMFDRDIVMLQAGAALMDSNEYLIHLLHKYGLMLWVRREYDTPATGGQEDSVRQTVQLAEEFLNLVILVLSERYVPGVGVVSSADVVKREIIHQLCIQPLAHSELTKALPEDANHETGIEDVVNRVAVFRKPAGSGKGLYELKPECYAEYNPYFYHYTRAEQSKSEEVQRKRKKQAKEDQALPPPMPPPFTPGFASINNILRSELLLEIIIIVLERTAAAHSRSWSETQFEKVLHLIGLGLYEEKRAHDNGGASFHFVDKLTHGDHSIWSQLESLVGHANIQHEAQKDLLNWVIKYFKEVRALKSDREIAMETTSASTSATDAKFEEEKKRKAKLAAQRRARIMAQMADMQKNFIEENKDLFENTSTELTQSSSDMDISEASVVDDSPVAVGVNKSAVTVSSLTSLRETCILCQEEQEVAYNERAMVLSALVQRSTVLSQTRGKTIEKRDEYEPLFMSSDLLCGPYTGTCGHVMHADCWQRFYDAIVAKERRRPHRFRQHLSYDIEKMEFLCPLCETLSNTVIPIIPHLATLTTDSKQNVDLKFHDWLDGLQKTVQNSIKEARDLESQEESFLFVPCPLSSITKMMAESVSEKFQLLFDYVYDDTRSHFSDSIVEMLRKFSSDAYSIGLGVDPDEENVRVPVLAWSTCSFTIMAIEQCLRSEEKPLFGAFTSRQSDCVSALVKFGAVSNQVMQTGIVKKHCVGLLSALLLDSTAHRFGDTPSIIDLDMFHYLVLLCMALPTLYAEEGEPVLSRIPTGGLNDQHALQLVLIALIVQMMLVADLEGQEDMEVECDTEGEALLKIYSSIRQHTGITSHCPPSAWHLNQYVRDSCRPFLRCAAIFFHYLTGVPPPESLQEFDTADEFEVMCQYLGLPDKFSLLFDNQGELLPQLVKSWCSDESVIQKLSANSEQILRFPIRVNQLVDLPDDYSQLINQASTFTCPKSDGEDSRAPMMCLVCGEMLCSQSYCCQTELEGAVVGAATAHAHTCGAGISMFLRVRECQVLLLSGKNKGCFFPPPYLDDYGETDQGLRRGNPLHLCRERYKKLQKLWLGHAIPEEIAHCLESNTSLMSIDWQNL